MSSVINTNVNSRSIQQTVRHVCNVLSIQLHSLNGCQQPPQWPCWLLQSMTHVVWSTANVWLALHRVCRWLLTDDGSVSWVWAEHWAEVLNDLAVWTRLTFDTLIYQQWQRAGSSLLTADTPTTNDNKTGTSQYRYTSSEVIMFGKLRHVM